MRFNKNCRLAEVGRDLWKSAGPTPTPAHEGHLELVAQDYAQTTFEYLPGRDAPPALPA